jgi:L-lactate permease
MSTDGDVKSIGALLEGLVGFGYPWAVVTGIRVIR